MNIHLWATLASIALLALVAALPSQNNLLAGNYQHHLLEILPDSTQLFVEGQTKVTGRSLVHVATIRDENSHQTQLVRVSGTLYNTFSDKHDLHCNIELVYFDHLDKVPNFLSASPYLFYDRGACQAMLEVVYEDPQFLLIKDHYSGHTQLIKRL